MLIVAYFNIREDDGKWVCKVFRHAEGGEAEKRESGEAMMRLAAISQGSGEIGEAYEFG